MPAGNGPKHVMVEYDNFPPNKTIGPEMKVVIPPIPTHLFKRSSPKNQQPPPPPQMMANNFGHFSPIHASEAQEFSDSDSSDWETGAMAGFGGFV